jgi:hypothetical protein
LRFNDHHPAARTAATVLGISGARVGFVRSVIAGSCAAPAAHHECNTKAIGKLGRCAIPADIVIQRSNRSVARVAPLSTRAGIATAAATRVFFASTDTVGVSIVTAAAAVGIYASPKTPIHQTFYPGIDHGVTPRIVHITRGSSIAFPLGGSDAERAIVAEVDIGIKGSKNTKIIGPCLDGPPTASEAFPTHRDRL